MITKTFRLLAAIAAGIALSAAHGAPTLLVSNGILTGANGVLVDGVSYDVRFVDGSCNGLFNGCSTSAFAFTTSQAATDAGQALFDTVFVDGPLGNFGSSPALTQGCGAILDCNSFVPFLSYQTLSGATAVRAADVVVGSFGAGVGIAGLGATDDLTGVGDGVWAIFSRSSAVAAVPGTISLCFAGAGALLAFSRRRLAPRSPTTT